MGFAEARPIDVETSSLVLPYKGMQEEADDPYQHCGSAAHGTRIRKALPHCPRTRTCEVLVVKHEVSRLIQPAMVYEEREPGIEANWP